MTGNQPDLIQTEELLYFQGRTQMPVMNRIEATPEYTNHE
jgi:hypothetical protein